MKLMMASEVAHTLYGSNREVHATIIIHLLWRGLLSKGYFKAPSELTLTLRVRVIFY